MHISVDTLRSHGNDPYSPQISGILILVHMLPPRAIMRGMFKDHLLSVTGYGGGLTTFPGIPVVAFLFLSLCVHGVYGQSKIVLDSCGVSYVDPQNESGSDLPGLDTLVYTTYFEDAGQLRAYYVDINAFGGQQVDKAKVFALLPGGGRQLLGALSFGNCLECVEGFALVYNDSLLVKEEDNQEMMDRWLQSLNQPPYALPGNLQTLAGVGRISGELPLCAEGFHVEYIVSSNPQSTSTEFSTHIICPEILRDCSIGKEARIDCLKDSIYLEAQIPAGCYSDEVAVRWYNERGWSADGRTAALPLSGNEGKFYLQIEDGFCVIVDSLVAEDPSFAEAGDDGRACEGQSFTLKGSGGLSHYWDLADGGRVDSAVAVLPAVRPADQGLYVLHAFNEEGCEDLDSLLLTVDIPVDPVVEVSDACLGDTLRIALLNDSLFTEANWFDPQGQQLATPEIPGFQPSDFGLYSVMAVDIRACVAEKSFEVSGSDPPSFEFITEESCDSTRVFLIPPTYEYLWETGDRGPYFSTATGGLYQLTITDAGGCSSVDQIDLPVPDGPEAGLEVIQPKCPSDYGVIELLVDERDPLIFSIDGGQSFTVSPVFDHLDPGSYEVIIQDELLCQRRYSVEIFPPDTMGVDLDIDFLQVRPNTTVVLRAWTVGDIQTIQWLPSEIDSGDFSTEFIALDDLDIRVIVQDSKGCLASDGFSLAIILGDIYAPNAFSPNDDGVNDSFTLYSDNGSGEIIEQLQVFDRWGALIFETREARLNDELSGWDGSFNGKPMVPGVYTYHGKIRFGNGETRDVKGDVALIR